MAGLFARKPLSMLQAEADGEHRLNRILGPVALTALGVGAIIGTGIFVLTGKVAATLSGPALTVSLIVAAVTALFAALCYAEFAAMVPVAGSAYTYAYATMGELFAWIIGWDLIIEYAVAAASVAQGWSHYFQSFLALMHHGDAVVPKALANTPFDHTPAAGFFATGSVVDLPAIVIALAVTAILIKGIKESARFNAVIVSIKLSVILLVIGLGVTYVEPAHWHPFAPYGYGGIGLFGKTLIGHSAADGSPVGMMAGAALIFYAYIGFDSLASQAEEAKNPRRDVPLALILSLLICTVLYIAMALVLTGMVRYDQIDIHAPVAEAFRQVGKPWVTTVITLGALAGITSVLLVQMLAQPRIFMAMARDGLLPRGFFGAIHPRWKTPWKATMLTGGFVAVVGGLIPLNILADMVSIGTLLAFLMVCTAVLIMRRTHPDAPRPFRAPLGWFTPVAGIASSLTLMLSLPVQNWVRLVVWLALGLAIYFGYGRKHSVLGAR